MRNKTLLFNCVHCNFGVYRTGSRVNVDLKTCGRCSGGWKHTSKRHVKAPSLPQDQLETLLQAQGMPTVLESVKYYRKLLDKVEELYKTNQEMSFYELWRLAKQ